MDTIEVLIKQFPGVAMIPAVEAGKAIGYKPQTCYNLMSRKAFPLPVRKQGRNSMVALTDLAKYLDGVVDPLPTQEPEPAIKRRPGRPTKAEQIARRSN